jgi:hypothetical protein
MIGGRSPYVRGPEAQKRRRTDPDCMLKVQIAADAKQEAWMRLRLGSIIALLLLAGLAAGFQLSGTEPARAQCSVLSHHPCNPGGCSVLSGHPCDPGGCSVFRHRPCFPQILPPIGEDLRLTIMSDKPAPGPEGGEAAADGSATEGAVGTEHKLNTIHDLFDALRTCWVPPPEDEERPGMQMSVRLSFKRNGQIIGPPRVTYTSPDAPADSRDVYHDAIMAALDRCTPMPFSAGLGGAIAGRPIAIRYVDNRKLQ